MKFFVMSEDNITAVISADDDTHLKSARFIPSTPEAINAYREWLANHPDQQPTLSAILNAPAKVKINDESSDAIAARAQSIIDKAKDSSKPTAKPSFSNPSGRSALGLQLQQLHKSKIKENK